MITIAELNPIILKRYAKENWQAGLTVALISVPLSIALSIASGAGPIPGIITGVWATLIAGVFGGNKYNIIGSAGALTTILFAATLAAPFGLGASVLPLLAIVAGLVIFLIWLLKLDEYLYYIPSSVMYGFASGVALLIAASQLFDATGLSKLSRTGTLLGDIERFSENVASVHMPSLIVFAAFLAGILIWKHAFKKIPAVIPAAVIGIIAGYIESQYFDVSLVSLSDKFGSFPVTLMLPVAWNAVPALFKIESFKWVLETGSVIALIAVLETLITAKIADKITKTESSSSRELLGLALANMGSGVMGGLPASGVFIRTGANVKAGATHSLSSILAALFTAGIALIVLPFFLYIPMPVIAAILVNTALGLLEVEKYKEFWKRERESFLVAFFVALTTIFHDASLGVGLGVILALVLFARKVSRGRFDIVWNHVDGTKTDVRGERFIKIPKGEKPISYATYSIAGNLGYIDASRHLENLKKIARSDVHTVIIRLRNLFSVDFEGAEALAEAVTDLETHGKDVRISSLSRDIQEELTELDVFKALHARGGFYEKTGDALKTYWAECGERARSL